MVVVNIAKFVFPHLKRTPSCSSAETHWSFSCSMFRGLRVSEANQEVYEEEDGDG